MSSVVEDIIKQMYQNSKITNLIDSTLKTPILFFPATNFSAFSMFNAKYFDDIVIKQILNESNLTKVTP